MVVSYLNCNPVFNVLSLQANEAVTTVVVFGSMDLAVWSYLFISAFTSLFLNSVLFLRVYVCEYQIFVIELCLLDGYSAFNHLECCFAIKHLFSLIPAVAQTCQVTFYVLCISIKSLCCSADMADFSCSISVPFSLD
jgi:hypothetical protein